MGHTFFIEVGVPGNRHGPISKIFFLWHCYLKRTCFGHILEISLKETAMFQPKVCNCCKPADTVRCRREVMYQ